MNDYWLQIPSSWPGRTDLLTWSQNMGPATAAILIIAGVIYLGWGWYLFKTLITVNAVVIGAYIGAMIGDKANSALAGGLIGGLLAGLAAWPLLKYAVAVMGGIVGFLLGAAIWLTLDLDIRFAWAGGLIGLVGFGMLSFILFRGSIIMYTSLQGSVMLIFGLLGMIYKYQSVGAKVTEGLTLKPMLLPMLVVIAAFVGLIYQQTQHAGGPSKE